MPENASPKGGGMEWIPTPINLDDAQFLAARQSLIVEIACLLRIPPHKIITTTPTAGGSVVVAVGGA